MTKDRKKLYIVTALLALAFFLVLFVQNGSLQRGILTAVSVLVCIAALILIKKRIAPELEWRQLAWLLPAIGVIILLTYYLLGFVFGFTKRSLPPLHLVSYVIPIVLTVASSEIVRRVLLSQKNKLVTVVSYISLVLCDVALVNGGNVFASSSKFVNFVGMILLPAITANLLYHYVSYKYGAIPVVIYKALMTSYTYLIPLKPAFPDVMLAFLKIVLPLVILLFIRFLYERRKFAVSRQNVYLKTVLSCVLIVFMLLSVMLISCKFRYGMMVIATESMTGSIDKGDAIVYKRYDGEPIEEGQVIIFEKNGVMTVHRVVDIENINGETRYYTKGDANESQDPGYITSQYIVGTTDVTIKYIGHPTLWMRRILK